MSQKNNPKKKKSKCGNCKFARMSRRKAIEAALAILAVGVSVTDVKAGNGPNSRVLSAYSRVLSSCEAKANASAFCSCMQKGLTDSMYSLWQHGDNPLPSQQWRVESYLSAINGGFDSCMAAGTFPDQTSFWNL